jgi:hypothetical protein
MFQRLLLVAAVGVPVCGVSYAYADDNGFGDDSCERLKDVDDGERPQRCCRTGMGSS